MEINKKIENIIYLMNFGYYKIEIYIYIRNYSYLEYTGI